MTTAPATLAAAATPIAIALPSQATSRSVTLETGDRVTVASTPNNPARVSVTPVGPGESFQFYRAPSGDQYVIPSIAQPYLGRGLDLAQFDVSALFRNNSGRSTQPGLAAALRTRIGADVAAGRPAGSTPLPGKSAGNPSSMLTQPHYPLRTLRLMVLDGAGKPANALIDLMNTDSLRKIYELLPANDGIAQVAVPLGNYCAVAYVPEFDASGKTVDVRQVVLSDFTVTSGSGPTSTTLDARTATSKISVQTPRPATQDRLLTNTDRLDATGAGEDFAQETEGDIAQYVTPQPPAKVGRLHLVVQWGGKPLAAATDPYRYDVAFPTEGVPRDLAFTVRPDQLATVHQHLFADPAGGTVGGLGSGVQDEVGQSLDSYYVAIPSNQPMPQNLIDYIGTADGGRWFQETQEPNGMGVYADPRTVTAGQTYTIDWGHGPLAPDFGKHSGSSYCKACIAGNTLTFGFTPLNDSDPTHFTLGGGTMHVTLYRDGAIIADRNGASGAAVENLPATNATLRAVFDNDLSTIPGVSQSTRSHTDLTVQYRPGSDPALPAEDSCEGQSATTPCTLLPALDLNYQLATDETGTSHLPVQFLTLHVGHASYDGISHTSPITDVRVRISFDGGTTWQQATVTGSGSDRVAFWPNPASAYGTRPMLAVTAADADGGSIDQTITDAYLIAATRD